VPFRMGSLVDVLAVYTGGTPIGVKLRMHIFVA
jgi:hypothetical protein